MELPDAVPENSMFQAFKAWRTARAASALDEVNLDTLSVADAESRARSLLKTDTTFQTTRGPLSLRVKSELDSLPGGAGDLFALYATITGAGVRLVRDEIAPLPRDAAFVRAGSDGEHADVLIRRRDGRVFVAGNGAMPGEEAAHRSIWHYLLRAAAA